MRVRPSPGSDLVGECGVPAQRWPKGRGEAGVGMAGHLICIPIGPFTFKSLLCHRVAF